MKKRKKQTNFRISDELIKTLEELAKAKNMTKTEIIELGIIEMYHKQTASKLLDELLF